jgi:hypothetical protein
MCKHCTLWDDKKELTKRMNSINQTQKKAIDNLFKHDTYNGETKKMSNEAFQYALSKN